MQSYRASNITVSFPDSVDVTQTSDGGLIVHGAQELVRIEHTATHAQINRQGDDDGDLPLAIGEPILLPPGGCAILQLAGGGRGDYWSVPGRSGTSNALPIVSVPWGPQAMPVLRPPVLGSDPLSQFLRSAPIFEDQLATHTLPDVVELPDEAPPLRYWARLFGSYSGDHFSGWSTDTRTPDRQHPGYGSYLLGALSEAATALCSDTKDDKRPLARGIAQWGLDLAGAFASGRESWMADGGHCQGRTATLILAGYLLGVREMMDPMHLFGQNMVESRSYYRGKWWCGGMGGVGWRKHWVDVPYLSQHPRDWTGYQRWAFQGYYPHVVGGTIGTVLALRLLGLSRSLELPYRAVQAFMDGPGEAAIADLASVGISIPWGESYAVGSGAPDLCGRAWRRVFG
jgi:hypothetical protein